MPDEEIRFAYDSLFKNTWSFELILNKPTLSLFSCDEFSDCFIELKSSSLRCTPFYINTNTNIIYLQ